MGPFIFRAIWRQLFQQPRLLRFMRFPMLYSCFYLLRRLEKFLQGSKPNTHCDVIVMASYIAFSMASGILRRSVKICRLFMTVWWIAKVPTKNKLQSLTESLMGSIVPCWILLIGTDGMFSQLRFAMRKNRDDRSTYLHLFSAFVICFLLA